MRASVNEIQTPRPERIGQEQDQERRRGSMNQMLSQLRLTFSRSQGAGLARGRLRLTLGTVEVVSVIDVS